MILMLYLTHCPKCEASLTLADWTDKRCTQCGQVLTPETIRARLLVTIKRLRVPKSMADNTLTSQIDLLVSTATARMILSPRTSEEWGLIARDLRAASDKAKRLAGAIAKLDKQQNGNQDKADK